ncbi:MAG: recombinase RecJ [Tepidanaerobacter acetatoxydans]|jgi:c-di-AMP phosphodiesterase-like protein|uniref:DHH family phosphoesterase n=1 Tax=Tepidanaerobacter TaxID=499228 RepID=UPI000ABF1C95|nr:MULTISPECIES: DHH family phosphoesterase [Tepidanaerobacter]NLU10428.1 recombinase RecJ [Tepidanaerobacter acetatoxydans]
MIGGNKNQILWLAVCFIIVLDVVSLIFYDFKITLALLLILGLLLYYLISKKDGKPLPTLIETKTSFHQTLWKQVVNELNVGVALVTGNERIIWENKVFSERFQKSGKRISHINELVPQKILESLSEGPKEIELMNSRFFVKKTMLQTNGKKPGRILQAYYLEDVTEKFNLKLTAKEKETVVCYFYVDNFDEIMVACAEENRPELLAKIDKTITKWVHNFNGLVKKYDNDKYLVIMYLKDFRRAEETKFGVLDAIREIKVGQVMTPTLSIGAAYGESSLTQSGKIAQNALELCLGRGGDQAVVKAEGRTYFYGGKTEEMEKYSRVRVRVISHALRDLIEESDMVMVLGHLFLDMDALGAGVGLVSAIKSMNKPGYIILTPEQSPSVDSLLEFLFTDEEMQKNFIGETEALNKITKKTLVVVVDTHRPSLLMSQKVIEKAERVVVIDHHRRGEEFIDKALLVYLEPYASSTSEIVTEMIQYMGDDIKITPMAATAMLAGIAVDTRNFAFKTGARTFEAASYLKRAGADPTMVYKLFQEDAQAVYERAKVLKRAKEIADHVVISYYDEEPQNPTLAAAQAANSLIGLKGVSASFVLAPMGERITVSARSLGEINVQRILEELGGGGHMTVAGAQLSGMTMDEALERVRQAVLDYMKEGETK